MLSSQSTGISRKVLHKLRKWGSDFKRVITSQIYIRSLAGEFFPDGSEAHILVVKKDVYAKVAKVCVETFCFHNRFTSVIIHTDSNTDIAVKKYLRKLIELQRIQVYLDQSDELTWQEQKINLICEISGTQSIFMDADLKWNSSLPKITGLTFFVKEFSLDEHLEFSKFLTSAISDQQLFGSMKNTSFLAWNGKGVSTPELELLKSIYSQIKIESEKQPMLSEKLDVIRIAEQLALSIWAEKVFPSQIRYLKESDGFKDGSFVESSYFGATGSYF